MTKYLKLLTVALFATMSFALTSCGGDEPDDPNGGEKDVQYTFKFNNKTYYYGYDVDYGIITLHQMGGFSLEKDYCFLAFEAQDVPIKTDENGLTSGVDQDENSSLDCEFTLEYFNPRTAKKGDVLKFKQIIQSHRKDTDDPKYMFDFNNYTYYREADGDFNNPKIFTWQSNAQGVVKFVSYTDDDDNGRERLTLEFVNVSMDLFIGDYDYSEYKDRSNKGVFNGSISFQAI